MKNRGWIVLLLCLFMPMLAHAASVRASLDRQSVSLGETVTLNLHVASGGSFTSMPDLSPLQQDFTILGQSQSSDISIVNGKRSSELVIGIVLQPKRVGTLTIPSLSVAGAQTTPLQLQVTPPSAAASSTPDRSVFLQAQITPQQGWVGQQFSYVVKLYYSGNLGNGSLDAPQINGVPLTQVGGDVRYDAQRGNTQYHVIERRYSLVPQHAGTLTIPATSFQGESIDPNDPTSFFGMGTPVTASSPPLTVQVQAAPVDWGKSTWLPARALTLTLDGWPATSATVRVGQPINLTMQLQATGLPADALPALSLPTVSGATVYPDQPKTATGNDGPWITGSSTRAFAVVPEQAGTLTIPATTLRWFDVQSGQAETATIPAHTLTVLPASGAAGAPVAPASNAAAVPGTSAATAPAATQANAIWRWVALAIALLWLLTVAAWWWSRRKPGSPTPAPAKTAAPESTRALREAFFVAARDGDAAKTLRCLLVWAQAERPTIRQPGELAAALADARQRDALAALQRRCYADGVAPATGDDGLVAAFQHGFRWCSDGAAGDDDGLPPLYPFDLRDRL